MEDILDVTGMTAGKLDIARERVVVSSVVRSAFQTVAPLAEAKQVDVALDDQAGTLMVLGDARRLQQVVWNLLTNAVKFTAPHGCVGVTVAPADGSGVITVRDSGVGIGPSFLPKAFVPFAQADTSATRQFGWLGLGLALAKYLVDAHGGTLDVESPGVGAGAMFRVTLPLATN